MSELRTQQRIAKRVRGAAINAMREAGETYADIGRLLGVTGTRVRQIHVWWLRVTRSEVKA